MGIEDIPVYRNSDDTISNIARLTRNGIIFPYCWCGASPNASEVQMMTGRYPSITGYFDDTVAIKQYDFASDKDTSILSILKDYGYNTRMINNNLDKLKTFIGKDKKKVLTNSKNQYRSVFINATEG